MLFLPVSKQPRGRWAWFGSRLPVFQQGPTGSFVTLVPARHVCTLYFRKTLDLAWSWRSELSLHRIFVAATPVTGNEIHMLAL
jgi:hypothetical protein